MLKAEIAKQLGSFRLDVSLIIEPGFVCLFGPSGAGKTTVLNILAGLMKPDKGEIWLDNTCLFSSHRHLNLPPQQRKIGYIFQESRLFPHLSVRQNLEFGFRLTAPPERRFGWHDVVEVSGVGGLLERKPAALSGGEKQRVALARAILASPNYLLMDEPLAALDVSARLGFMVFLRRIQEELALPIIYVSHDVSSVMNFARKLVVIEGGRTGVHGTPADHLPRLVSPNLVSTGDIANVFETRITARDPKHGIIKVESQGVQFILPPQLATSGDAFPINIPASEIILAVTEPEGLSASNILKGKITRISHLGDRVLVEVDAGETFIVEIVEATVARLELAAGKPVYLIIKATAFRRL